MPKPTWMGAHKKSYQRSFNVPRPTKKGNYRKHRKGVIGSSKCRKDGSPPKFLKACGIVYRPHVKGYTKKGVPRKVSARQAAWRQEFGKRYGNERFKPQLPPSSKASGYNQMNLFDMAVGDNPYGGEYAANY